MRRYILIVIGIIILSGVVAPLAFAAESSITFVPQISIPGTNIQAGQTINIDGTTIGRYIIALYTFGVYAAGIVATVMLMAAGFVWLMAGGNSSQVEQAKTMIRGALTGYVLLLVSWVLLNTINPNLTEFRNLDINPVQPIELPTSNAGCCYFPQSENIGVISRSECADIIVPQVGVCRCDEKTTVLSGGEQNCKSLGSNCKYESGSEGKQLAEAKSICDTQGVDGALVPNNTAYLNNCQEVDQCKDILRDSGRLGRCSADDWNLTGSGCDNGYVCNDAWSCIDANDPGTLKAGAGQEMQVPSGGGFGCCKPAGLNGAVCVVDEQCAQGYICWGADDPVDFNLGGFLGDDSVILGECRKVQ